jgi:nitrogen fixation protein FixH
MLADGPRAAASQERRSKYFWVTVILCFFALDIAIAVIAIVMAAGDPSFRPMPDYGDRSVAWEVHHQDRLKSEKLGWSIDVSAVEPDRNALEFKVHDRDGKPVDHALGIASAYHLTRVAEQQHSEVVETDQGTYRAKLDCQRPGLWKINLRLNRAPSSTIENQTANEEEVFVYESTIELPRR